MKAVILSVILSVAIITYGFADNKVSINNYMRDLTSSDENVRSDACLALGKIGGSESVPALKEALRDKSMLVRHSAAMALSSIGGDDVEKIFMKMLASNGVEKRRIASIGLGKIGAGDDAVTLLINQLKDKNWQVRWSVCFALGLIGERKAVQYLKIIAENDSYQKKNGEFPVRMAALEAVDQIRKTIRWYGSTNAAYQAAKKTGKPLLMVFILKKSKWSKKLLSETFLKKMVVRECDNFVCARLDPGMYVKETKDYSVKAVPTIIFADTEGAYIDKIEGYVTGGQLLDKMKMILKDSNSMEKLLQIVKENPINMKAHMALAERYMELHEAKKALIHLSEIIKNDSKNTQGYMDKALYMAGYIYGSIGDYAESIRLLDFLIKQFPSFPELPKARYCMALGLIAQGDHIRAKRELGLILQTYPQTDIAKAAQDVIKKISK